MVVLGYGNESLELALEGLQGLCHALAKREKRPARPEPRIPENHRAAALSTHVDSPGPTPGIAPKRAPGSDRGQSEGFSGVPIQTKSCIVMTHVSS